MQSKWKLILAALLVSLAGFGMTGCDRDEGPVEETREAIEEGAEEVEDEVDDATS